MAFVRVGSLSQLQPGWVLEARIDGQTYALCNSGGEIHALDGSCPCTGGPLGQGALRDDLLVCPWHGWRFDCRSGVSAYDPEIRVAKVPVKISGGDIFLDIQDSTFSRKD